MTNKETIMKDLYELFSEQLADLYDAEKQLVKALPKMAENACSSDLRSAFREHLDQTKTHVERLEEVFEILDKSAKGKKCEAMEGLIAEAKELMEESAENVKDAALIAAAQKIEHYEIASYGCLRTWADLLEMDQASTFLQETLDEEKETDEKLTDIAGSINVEAREEEEEETSSKRGGKKQSRGKAR
jgi:ferritin-like metal-binding protein YciE